MQSELKRRPLCCVRVAAVLLAVAIATPSAAAERRLDQIAQLDRSSSPTREPLPPIVGGVPFLIRFAGSARGLQPGSPVEVQGIRIGNVLSVDVEYAADKNNFVVPVKIELQPSLFPAAGPHPHNAEETYAAADVLVRRGLLSYPARHSSAVTRPSRLTSSPTRRPRSSTAQGRSRNCRPARRAAT
jgi:hypothetical protein